MNQVPVLIITNEKPTIDIIKGILGDEFQDNKLVYGCDYGGKIIPKAEALAEILEHKVQPRDIDIIQAIGVNGVKICNVDWDLMTRQSEAKQKARWADVEKSKQSDSIIGKIFYKQEYEITKEEYLSYTRPVLNVADIFIQGNWYHNQFFDTNTLNQTGWALRLNDLFAQHFESGWITIIDLEILNNECKNIKGTDSST